MAAACRLTDEVDPLFNKKLLCVKEPHQSASLTASPKGEAFQNSLLQREKVAFVVCLAPQMTDEVILKSYFAPRHLISHSQARDSFPKGKPIKGAAHLPKRDIF